MIPMATTSAMTVCCIPSASDARTAATYGAQRCRAAHHGELTLTSMSIPAHVIGPISAASGRKSSESKIGGPMIRAARMQAMTARRLEPVNRATPQATAITAAMALANGTRWSAASE
jgi:hypothetical protein